MLVTDKSEVGCSFIETFHGVISDTIHNMRALKHKLKLNATLCRNSELRRAPPYRNVFAGPCFAVFGYTVPFE